MKKIDKEKTELLQQLEQIRRRRPDVYEILLSVWEEAMSLPENKRVEFLKKATPILTKYIH